MIQIFFWFCYRHTTTSNLHRLDLKANKHIKLDFQKDRQAYVHFPKLEYICAILVYSSYYLLRFLYYQNNFLNIFV